MRAEKSPVQLGARRQRPALRRLLAVERPELHAGEEEQLVPDDRPAEAAAVVVEVLLGLDPVAARIPIVTSDQYESGVSSDGTASTPASLRCSELSGRPR